MLGIKSSPLWNDLAHRDLNSSKKICQLHRHFSALGWGEKQKPMLSSHIWFWRSVKGQSGWLAHAFRFSHSVSAMGQVLFSLVLHFQRLRHNECYDTGEWWYKQGDMLCTQSQFIKSCPLHTAVSVFGKLKKKQHYVVSRTEQVLVGQLELLSPVYRHRWRDLSGPKWKQEHRCFHKLALC